MEPDLGKRGMSKLSKAGEQQSETPTVNLAAAPKAEATAGGALLTKTAADLKEADAGTFYAKALPKPTAQPTDPNTGLICANGGLMYAPAPVAVAPAAPAVPAGPPATQPRFSVNGTTPGQADQASTDERKAVAYGYAHEQLLNELLDAFQSPAPKREEPAKQPAAVQVIRGGAEQAPDQKQQSGPPSVQVTRMLQSNVSGQAVQSRQRRDGRAQAVLITLNLRVGQNAAASMPAATTPPAERQRPEPTTAASQE
jgi:hypothetical protein